MLRNQYSLKMNVFFYLTAEKTENFPTQFSDLKINPILYMPWFIICVQLKKSVSKNELNRSDNPIGFNLAD